MTTETVNPLVEFSNALADLAQRSGPCIVAMNARRRRSISGIHWRSGIIITSDECLKREDEIAVTVAEGQVVTATLMGRDPGTDLAILQVPDLALPTVTRADTPVVQVGQMVLAIGRSRENSVTASLGVISTVGGEWRSMLGGRIDQLIRPSLMMYPGLAGSALVNMQGETIGMNTAGPRHLAITIPSRTIDRTVDYFLSGGRSIRGYLGLGMQAVQLPAALQTTLNRSQSTGVIIVSVEPHAPAEQAGILIGDILITLGDTPIQDVSDVHSVLEPNRIGQSLTASLIRGGVLTERTIVVGERPTREN